MARSEFPGIKTTYFTLGKNRSTFPHLKHDISFSIYDNYKSPGLIINDN